ncbi:hypothetical protein BHE74_00026977 [Ensete ventricosum]|nr:hypothetical protein BHE74_00026977 [Ensete ventricosum]
MVESYGGRAAAAVWGEGVARHTILMGVELGSVVPGHLHLGCLISCRPGPLGPTWLPPKCCCGCPSGAGLDESDWPIGSQAEVSARPVLVRVRKSANVSGDRDLRHFSYSSPGQEFHDPMVRQDHRPEFVERGPTDDGIVVALLGVVIVVLMKATVPSFVTAPDLCSDWVWGPEESLVSDLEKDLSSG